jgi:hypothetical protein
MPLLHYSWASNSSQRTDEQREKLIPTDLMPAIYADSGDFQNGDP